LVNVKQNNFYFEGIIEILSHQNISCKHIACEVTKVCKIDYISYTTAS